MFHLSFPETKQKQLIHFIVCDPAECRSRGCCRLRGELGGFKQRGGKESVASDCDRMCHSEEDERSDEASNLVFEWFWQQVAAEAQVDVTSDVTDSTVSTDTASVSSNNSEDSDEDDDDDETEESVSKTTSVADAKRFL